MTGKELVLFALGLVFVVVVGGYFLYALYKINQLKEPVKMPHKDV